MSVVTSKQVKKKTRFGLRTAWFDCGRISDRMIYVIRQILKKIWQLFNPSCLFLIVSAVHLTPCWDASNALEHSKQREPTMLDFSFSTRCLSPSKVLFCTMNKITRSLRFLAADSHPRQLSKQIQSHDFLKVWIDKIQRTN